MIEKSQKLKNTSPTDEDISRCSHIPSMHGQRTAAERREAAMQTARAFWQTHGAALEQENGPGTFKHAFVQAMKRLHAGDGAGAGADTPGAHRLMRDVLAEQRAFLVQFESCLDEFNRYLAALRLVCVLDC